jgi:hypothetical protein
MHAVVNIQACSRHRLRRALREREGGTERGEGEREGEREEGRGRERRRGERDGWLDRMKKCMYVCACGLEKCTYVVSV